MQKELSPHGKLLHEVGEKFAGFTDAVVRIDFNHHSEEDLISFNESILYGINKLTFHLSAAIATKQKQQIRSFIHANRKDSPALDQVDLRNYEGQRLNKLHHLLLVDQRPMHKRLQELF